jgi:oligopeptide/dipeptide ABC transporter ATP-binding protein
MYLGVIAELGTVDDLYANPLHPYTQALLSAVPVPDPVVEETRQRIILEGDPPSPIHPPKGCRFHTRCHKRFDRCDKEEPVLREVAPRHWVSCHLY